MKWKDTGEMTKNESVSTASIKEENFDEEKYSPWAEQKGQQQHTKFFKIPVLLIILVVVIVSLVVITSMLVISGQGGSANSQQLSLINERLQKLEDRLDKFEAIDEKVTRIWEQAKSFEKFKDRFERSEASTSLRMDHLTMSLEALQKQFTKARIPTRGSIALPQKAVKKTNKLKYHHVQAGDTLYSISKRYKIKIEQLLKLNKIKPGAMIQPGQKLIVQRPSE